MRRLSKKLILRDCRRRDSSYEPSPLYPGSIQVHRTAQPQIRSPPIHYKLLNNATTTPQETASHKTPPNTKDAQRIKLPFAASMHPWRGEGHAAHRITRRRSTMPRPSSRRSSCACHSPAVSTQVLACVQSQTARASICHNEGVWKQMDRLNSPRSNLKARAKYMPRNHSLQALPQEGRFPKGQCTSLVLKHIDLCTNILVYNLD